jgi:hypothetical protein
MADSRINENVDELIDSLTITTASMKIPTPPVNRVVHEMVEHHVKRELSAGDSFSKKPWFASCVYEEDIDSAEVAEETDKVTGKELVSRYFDQKNLSDFTGVGKLPPKFFFPSLPYLYHFTLSYSSYLPVISQFTIFLYISFTLTLLIQIHSPYSSSRTSKEGLQGEGRIFV